jgi:hypothetical protein
MSRVLVEGRTLELCRGHAATVVAAMPETFEDLRALFVGVGPGLTNVGAAAATGESWVSVERRSPITRREPEDRRVFPPRPEGRRLSTGRRATDPLD